VTGTVTSVAEAVGVCGVEEAAVAEDGVAPEAGGEAWDARLGVAGLGVAGLGVAGLGVAGLGVAVWASGPVPVEGLASEGAFACRAFAAAEVDAVGAVDMAGAAPSAAGAAADWVVGAGGGGGTTPGSGGAVPAEPAAAVDEASEAWRGAFRVVALRVCPTCEDAASVEIASCADVRSAFAATGVDSVVAAPAAADVDAGVLSAGSFAAVGASGVVEESVAEAAKVETAGDADDPVAVLPRPAPVGSASCAVSAVSAVPAVWLVWSD
jgi:hypothetical protein